MYRESSLPCRSQFLWHHYLLIALLSKCTASASLHLIHFVLSESVFMTLKVYLLGSSEPVRPFIRVFVSQSVWGYVEDKLRTSYATHPATTFITIKFCNIYQKKTILMMPCNWNRYVNISSDLLLWIFAY